MSRERSVCVIAKKSERGGGGGGGGGCWDLPYKLSIVQRTSLNESRSDPRYAEVKDFNLERGDNYRDKNAYISEQIFSRICLI